MRRVVLFAAVLALVGLSTAFAASFSTQAEDVESFTTDVSISVPGPTPFPGTLFVRNGKTGAPGSLDLVAPTTNDSVASKELILSAEAINLQTTSTKYFTWSSPTAPTNGYSLTGDVTLEIEQRDGPSNRMTAGLFSCPAASPVSTVTTGAEPCTIIAIGVAPALPSGGNGYLLRTVSFPDVAATIPSGSQLRLKLVNRASDPSLGTLSTVNFSIQWGYLPARQSKLVITP